MSTSTRHTQTPHHRPARPTTVTRADHPALPPCTPTMNDRHTAFMREMYTEHAGALWRYAMRLTGDRARAEDVVQETLLRACQHEHLANDSQRSPRAWLFRVARNMIIDDRRSRRFRSETSAAEGMDQFEHCVPDEVDAALDRLLIADALTHLSPEHRAVVRRSYYLGWTITQIATDLQIAEGTVKSRLHYALRTLRLALQEMGVTR